MKRELFQALGWSDDLITAFQKLQNEMGEVPGIEALPEYFSFEQTVSTGTIPDLDPGEDCTTLVVSR